MANVRRIYVEKKSDYAVSAKKLQAELTTYLGIKGIKNVRILNRYDIEGLSDETYQKALRTIFSEPPVDMVYEENFDYEGRVFSVEYLPGQFDQRADSAVLCVRFLNEKENPKILSAFTYVISGDISDSEFEAIKKHCINSVDSRETSMVKPETLEDNFKEPEDVKILEGFIDEKESDLKDLYDSLNLAMTFEDFSFIRDYFKDKEHRNPSITEIRVLDTYWSDHCRHTTFSTELTKVTFSDGYYKKPMEDTFLDYKDNFKALYKDRDDKFICLMDLALMGAKVLKKKGILIDQEVSDEINACSIVVPVEIEGEVDEWLINFKNETHNHPTEIEPFGGAATCLGGAIRDPLSGRTYVYQAMRITGASDPTVAIKDTIPGKLPQKKLVKEAAHGYSSYGNQIGLATGYVKELYHPNYQAKRMEIGAVIAAAPKKAVKRLTSDPGDRIILLGGRTGRDGIGGATGSSKSHNKTSTSVCGAEVQKGNPPTERKIQRLFKREEVSLLIKKCNDFGAGGVSVAIGELADGLIVDLDKVPKKYAGLDGTELAISESQERMAVVVSPSDVDKFLEYAHEENLEAVEVAMVTSDPRMILKWRGKEIVNLSRAFIDTNGAHQETEVFVELPDENDNFFKKIASPKVDKALEISDVKKACLETLSDLNVCSERGLVEMFDSSIGAATVTMPYGGKYQKTEMQGMVSKLPVGNRKCDAVTMMTYGFDPYLSSWSPYHGAQYAVLSSVSKMVALGGDAKKIHFTFQEYFRKMTSDPKRWSQPFSALLGAYRAQMELKLGSIGGKDSMSGTFEKLDVPPTLVSFAVCTDEGKNIITPEFKKAGNKVYLVKLSIDEYTQPEFDTDLRIFSKINKLQRAGGVVSSYSVEAHGAIEAIFKMAFGNNFGFRTDINLSAKELFKPYIGALVLEVKPGFEKEMEEFDSVLLGTIVDGDFEIINNTIKREEALFAWENRLEEVFPTSVSSDKSEVSNELYVSKDIYVCKHKVSKPKVFIPVFPGTNCEFDSAKAFEKAGASCETIVFRDSSENDIRESVEAFRKAISDAQIVMFPGGFSGGDEPEGSAKFFATAFRNEVLKDELMKLLDERDGLCLGICNGFQALIKLGLVPFGEIRTQTEDSPTLTYNTIGRHISREVYLRVCSNKSPWLRNTKPGDVFVNPASHGEGRFVAPKEWLDKLFLNGQVATQYCDPNGNVTMNDEWNVNGSYMAIEGITSPDGRVLGKMAHSERQGENVAINIYGEQDMKIFESGVEYFTR
ncbi:MAG: phosphoribosylformylglycinamidine synthase [Lachnospiraceae bacterium]|nr:phosphoribosylformylglycinamidine synthase [Lachnospiraceae bacterium]